MRAVLPVEREPRLGERLLRVEAPHYVAGVIIDVEGIIVEAAPILRWAVGRTSDALIEHAQRRGYRLT